MNDPRHDVVETRRRPGVFTLAGEAFARGVIAVSGGDARRWLDGMLSNDVTRISAEGPARGCYATLLTTRGRIVADLHVLARPDGFWLEMAAFVVGDVIARLAKYIVADDVVLADRSADTARLAVEGPGSTALLEAAGGCALSEVPAEGWATGRIADCEVTLARFGWTGEEAWQLFVPASAGPAVGEALVAAGAGARSLDALEVLRIEAGVPRLGPELDEEVFPDEARLDAAISRSKGCYTGQEIVARLYSRGAVNHLLVALDFEGDTPPPAESSLFCGDKRTGEVTSACLSPSLGAIGLGYVRKEHADAGTVLRCVSEAGEVATTVAALRRAGLGAGS